MKTNISVSLIILLFVIIVIPGKAQTLYNNGITVKLENTKLYVGGTFDNNSGTLNIQNAGNLAQIIVTGNFINSDISQGDGEYHISGDWVNNGSFTANTSTVFLEGGYQNVGGTSTTTFYNLHLSGSNMKTLTNDQFCIGVLNLNDIELFTAGFDFEVTNTDPSAITRTTGFISSGINGGLIRNTNMATTYLFPVGSSIGTLRYRPLDIIPEDALSNRFKVRMANTTASVESFDITEMSSELCSVNSQFFHHISQVSGSSVVGINMYFDPATDGNWNSMANWTLTPDSWAYLSGSNSNTSSPMDYININGFNNFNQSPFSLANSSPNISVSSNSIVCIDDPLNLFESGGDATSWNWSGPNGFTSIEENPTILNCQLSDEGYYTVEIIDNFGCTVIDSTFVEVAKPPTATITSNSPVCEGDALTLDETGGDADTWSWTGPDDFTSAMQNNEFTASSLSHGGYSVTVTDLNGCTASADHDVTINNLAVAPENVSASFNSICSGESSVLSFSGGSGDTFIWYEGNCGTNPVGTGNNFIVAPSSTQVYYGRWENSCGNSDCESINVAVSQSIGGVAGTNQTIASGTSPTDLNLSGYQGDIQWQYSTNGSTGWTNISGATNPVLGSAQMGVLTEDRWYRALVNDPPCDSENSNVVLIQIQDLNQISGQVMYAGSVQAQPAGASYNQPQYHIDSTIVILEDMSGMEIGRDTTFSDGTYALTDIENDTYILRTEKIHNMYNTWINNITALDVSLFKGRIVQPDNLLFIFEDYYFNTMDINNDDILSSVDEALLRLKIVSPFDQTVNDMSVMMPLGIWNNSLDTLEINTGIVNYDPIIIGFGDYNADADAYLYNGNPSPWSGSKAVSSDFLTHENGHTNSTQNENQFVVNLNTVEEYDRLKGLQIEFRYPNNQIKLKNASLLLNKEHLSQFINQKSDQIIENNPELIIKDDNGMVRLLYVPSPEKTFDLSYNQKFLELEFEKLSSSVTISNELNITGVYNEIVHPNYTRSKNIPITYYRDNNPSYAENQQLLTDIEIYPNPATNKLFIELPAQKMDNIDIELLDVLGKTIINKTNVDTDSNIIELDIQNLVQGMYYIRINASSNASRTSRILKFIKK